MDKDMGDPGGVTTVSSSELRSELREEDGPWMIYSHYHACWHRRSVDQDGNEHATGYTDDLARAGVFGMKIARAYNDWSEVNTMGRDEAVPIRRAADALIRKREELADLIAGIDARIKTITNGASRQDAADPHPRDEQQPLQETDHDR